VSIGKSTDCAREETQAAFGSAPGAIFLVVVKGPSRAAFTEQQLLAKEAMSPTSGIVLASMVESISVANAAPENPRL
jgi:hypothetical protein